MHSKYNNNINNISKYIKNKIKYKENSYNYKSISNTINSNTLIIILIVKY